MLAKLILAVTMAASAILGGTASIDQEQAATFDNVYLHVDDHGRPSIWQESNGHPGLQTAPIHLQRGILSLNLPPDQRALS